MRPDVVTFWHGPLDRLRQTCLRSQVAAGHKVTVYSFEPLAGIARRRRQCRGRSDPAARLLRKASPAAAGRQLARLDHAAVLGFFPDAADGAARRAVARRRRAAAKPVEIDPAKPFFAWERPRQLGNSVLYLPPGDAIVAAFEALMRAGRADAGLAGAAASPDLRAAQAARQIEPALRYSRRDLRSGGADRARRAAAANCGYALPKKSFYAVHAEPKLFFDRSDFSALIARSRHHRAAHLAERPRQPAARSRQPLCVGGGAVWDAEPFSPAQRFPPASLI